MSLAIVRVVCIAAGVISFYYFADFFNRMFSPEERTVVMGNRAGFMIAGGLLGILVSPYLHSYLLRLHKQTMRTLRVLTPQLALKGFIGLMVGLMTAVFLSIPVSMFVPEHRVFGILLAVCCWVVFGYIGIMIFVNVDIPGLESRSAAAGGDRVAAAPKVLDTSVIIDGRILELCRSGFIEGRIIVPSVVVEELQKIADDPEELRRRRGRRGLDVVRQMREDSSVTLEIAEADPRDVRGGTADAKIVSLARDSGAVLITNDYNLTKVAELRDVRVWNLNTIAGSLRKALLPGEKLEVNIVKYGKEVGQGVAYLDDGTMIVVESGDAFMGETIEVEIKSLLQTVAGRLIFAAVSGAHRKEES
ncbi:MAG: PIN domain-containing protein [bacterium]